MIDPLVAEVESVDVLLIGTYHMANPGHDIIKFVADDVLAEHRQKELAELVEKLSKFQPTKVCVEVSPDDQEGLDKLFAQYLAGEMAPRRDELAQVAFPLAAAMDLTQVYGIDDKTPMQWEALEAFFSSHPEEDRWFKARVVGSQKQADEASQRLAKMPIWEYLQELNRPESFHRDAALYVDLAGLGAVGEYPGAEMLASWYERNIRIFSNLSGITASGDRIFVLFGIGHIPILRELVALSSRHHLVEVQPYLR